MSDGSPRTESVFAVDMDETLLKTDVLLEQGLLFARSKPWAIPCVLYWALQGPTRLKEELASRTDLAIETLPVRETVIELIRKRKALGHRVVLATAGYHGVAEKVAARFGLFDLVLGSDRHRNLKGKEKLNQIQNHFPGARICYAGDSQADLAIWESCDEVVSINPSYRILGRLKQMQQRKEIIQDRKNFFLQFARMLRVHQWSKNLLIFLPMIAAHHFLSFDHLVPALLAFFSFSLLASSIYVINDILDLESDRRHPTKRLRPMASGEIPIRYGLMMVPLLVGSSIAMASRLPTAFLGILFAYFAVNLGYSFWLKRMVAVDVVFLAGLYTLRIFAGGQATDVPVSEWLMAFSTFFFFGLAMEKRFIEIARQEEPAGKAIHSRGYRAEDKYAVFGLGAASTFLSVLVMALYLNSPEVRKLYEHPERLWLMCPLLLYWMSRTWILAHRGEVDDDPVVFAIKDPATWITGGLGLALILGSM